MTKILLSGANGKMGRVIAACVRERDDCTIVAGIDPSDNMLDGFHVFSSADQCTVPADVIIDFSHPTALDPLMDMAVQRKLPIVVATTGLSQIQIERIHKASAIIPVFYTANMSLGMNLMVELCKTAARVLGRDYDIEIIEKHHNQKIDAPSGTAFMLADAISSSLETPPKYVYDRHSQRKKREKNEIGMHAIRGGTIVGDHEVIFAGRDEVLTVQHNAASKEIFATGALSAALFLAKQSAGMYSMKDLI